jgi:hypothetical protein
MTGTGQPQRELSHAVELCPNDAGVHREHAYRLGWSGRGAEASAEMAKARELDPLSPWFSQAAELINYHLRNYKAMIEVGRRHVARTKIPGLPTTFSVSAMKVQAKRSKRFLSIRRPSSYRRATQTLPLDWRTHTRR